MNRKNLLPMNDQLALGRVEGAVVGPVSLVRNPRRLTFTLRSGQAVAGWLLVAGRGVRTEVLARRLARRPRRPGAARGRGKHPHNPRPPLAQPPRPRRLVVIPLHIFVVVQ